MVSFSVFTVTGSSCICTEFASSYATSIGCVASHSLNSSVVVSTEDIQTGNRITVNVNASGNGSATIVVFNSTKIIGTYSLLISNGKGSMIIPHIFNYTGTYNVNVTYNGDDVYLSSHNQTNFDVTAAVDYDFKVITNTVLVGETAIVNVTLPSNANGNVILTLPNGTNLTVKAVKGVAVFEITGLPYGNYTLNATYAGDNNYQRATVQGKLSILKHESMVNLTCDIKDFNATGQIIGSVTAGGKVNLTVHLPNDATGNVTVYLNNHVIGENLNVDNGKVSIGNTVSIKYVEDEDEEEYKIVGSQEADPFESKISNESPIAQALFDHKVGDIVTVNSPNGSYEVEIIDIK